MAQEARTLKVGIIQQANSADHAENKERLQASIRQVAAQGAELVVLQELHNGLYFCQTEDVHVFDQAEPIPGPSTEEYGALARELGIVLVLSLFERRAAGLYHNTSVVLERDGSIAGKYRKMHIPDDPAYYEKFYFTPGDLGFEPIETSVGTLGVLVCWDQWYPEAARLMALAGAELLIYPTAIGWESSDVASEQQRQRSIAWVTRRIPRGRQGAYSSGDAASSRVLRASSSRSSGRRRPSPSSRSTSAAASAYVAGGPSYVTAVSTPSRTSPSATAAKPR